MCTTRTVPTISSGFYLGSGIELTMSEEVWAGTMPAATDFKVKSGVSGSETANTVTGITGLAGTRADAGTTVALTLTNSVPIGRSVKVWYTKGTNTVEDEAGNVLASLAEASAVTMSEAKTVSVSAVSGGFVTDAEDESSLTISGSSANLTTGTSITVAVDGSGTDVSKTGTTDSSGDWSVSLTSDQVKALDAASPAIDGEVITVTASATGAVSGNALVCV